MRKTERRKNPGRKDREGKRGEGEEADEETGVKRGDTESLNLGAESRRAE